MIRPSLFWLAAGLSLSCATPLKRDATVCPEYRDLRCSTSPECSMDAARGCRVCACEPAQNGTAPRPTLPPDLRTPR